MRLRICTPYILAVMLAFALWLPGTEAAAQVELSDGTYTADYVVLQADNDSVSMANDYWEKPATITVKNGKATIRLTINHSAWVTEFKVPANGRYVDTKVIETDDAANTRLVQFTVTAAEIGEPIVSKIHVTVPEIDYDHDYTIRMSFKTDSLASVPQQTEDTTSGSAGTDPEGSGSAAADDGEASAQQDHAPAAPGGSSVNADGEPSSPDATADSPSQSVTGPATDSPASPEELQPAETPTTAQLPSRQEAGEEGSVSSGSDNRSVTDAPADTSAVSSGREPKTPVLEEGASDGAASADADSSAERQVDSAIAEESGMMAVSSEQPAARDVDAENESASGSRAMWWILAAIAVAVAAGVIYVARRSIGKVTVGDAGSGNGIELSKAQEHS